MSTLSQTSILLFTIFYATILQTDPSTALQTYTLLNDSSSIRKASNDYGNIVHEIPRGVLFPTSVKDIINLIKSSNSRPRPFTVAARGRGHSVRGQAMSSGGVVVDMSALARNSRRIRVSGNSSLGFYANVGGEQLWIDVLRATLALGLAPVSWTDYLYLSVGGTLSNAGVSGQSFLHGPQINNVLELDVITGKGDFVTCSKKRNPDLFFGVLGGLGQFGIITRARIILHKAPARAKWVRLIYSDFSKFSRDQEFLISSNVPNYVEGFLIVNESTTNEWRASNFSSPSTQSDVVSLLKKNGLLYSIELVKYYDNQTAKTIDQEFTKLLQKLNFIPKLIFSTDASLFDFLARVPNLDNSNGQQSHPWLNLFIPKSRISDFNAGVLTTMLPKLSQYSSSLFIFYPTNRRKWDDRMSAVTPDGEDIFYGLSLLHTSAPNEYQVLDDFNNQVLEFCEKNGIKVKRYLPNIKSQQDWIKQYGWKWGIIKQRKAKFDPRMILSPGQRIFNSV